MSAVDPRVRLSHDQREALAAFLLDRFRGWVVEKTDVAVIVITARLFGVLRLLGMNVPGEGEFMTRYWTTLGPVVFMPRGAGLLGEHLRVLAHEVGHVVQFWRDPLGLVGRYFTKRGRAELEAEAERAAIEVWWLLTGELPASREALDVVRHGYALDDAPGPHDDHADLTRDLLETAVTSVRNGVISTDVGLAVAGWLTQRAPEAMVGRFFGTVPTGGAS